MRYAALLNCSRPLAACIRVGICDSFLTRLRGWMFARQILPGEGRLLDQKSSSRVNASIHMFFVNFDLAVLWLDNDLKVVDQVLARRWAPFYQPDRPARYVLEIHPRRLPEFAVGDLLSLEYE